MSDLNDDPTSPEPPARKSHGRLSARPSLLPTDLIEDARTVRGAWHARVITLLPDAFPGICHLLLRHADDPATALIENATAGGDNAARGLILGMVLGAKFPTAALPKDWLTGLRARDEFERLIQQLS